MNDKIIKKRKPMSEETKRKIGKANQIKMIQLWQNPEYRKNSSLKHLGKSWGYHTEQTKEKMRLAKLGNKNALGNKLSLETRNKISLAQMGNKNGVGKRSLETRRNISKSLLGKPRPYLREHPFWGNISNWFKPKEKHWNWKGGVTPLQNSIRKNKKYSLWQKEVFNKGNYTCIFCDKRGGILNIHHIFSLSEICKDWNIKNIEDALRNELLWNSENGIVMCENCHKLWHKTEKFPLHERTMNFFNYIYSGGK